MAEPSAMPALGSRPGLLRGIPSATAMSRIFCGPSGIDWVRSAYAVFTDCSVAVVRLMFWP